MCLHYASQGKAGGHQWHLCVDNCLICGNAQNHRFMKAYRDERSAFKWGTWEKNQFTMCGTDYVVTADYHIILQQRVFTECVWTPCLSPTSARETWIGGRADEPRTLSTASRCWKRTVAGNTETCRLGRSSVPATGSNKRAQSQGSSVSTEVEPEQVLITTCELCPSIGTLWTLSPFMMRHGQTVNDGGSHGGFLLFYTDSNMVIGTKSCVSGRLAQLETEKSLSDQSCRRSTGHILKPWMP